jgi:hypothetical protein
MFLKNERTGLPIYQCKLPQLVVITSDVPLEDLKIIKEAIHYWNSTLGHVNCGKILTCPPLYYAGVTNYKSKDIPRNLNHIVIGLFPEEEAEEPQDLGSTLPWLDKSGCITGNRILYIRERLENERRKRWLIAHELGHIFGLSHSNELNNLMNSIVPLELGCTKSSRYWPYCIPLPTKEQIKALNNIYHLE